MPPFARGRNMPAKHFRIYLYIYAIRHAFGIALVAWILSAAKLAPNPYYFWIAAAILAVYVVSALYNGKKIWNHYQKRLVEEAEARNATAVATPVEEVEA